MRFSAEQVAGMLLEPGARSGALHRQLSEGLGDLIDLGEIPPEATLPSERALAKALAVSRTTVVAAYQTLRHEGRLERRQGSGTRVTASGRPGDRETVSARALVGEHAGRSFVHGAPPTIDFSTAALPCLDLVPDVAASLTRTEYAALTQTHHGYQPRGLPALRERLAAMYTNDGVPTTPDQILVTSGAQQALELITHGCLQPGDNVVTEAPTYRGALEAFSLANCRIRSVPCDDHGMEVERLEDLAAIRPPRLIYVQSSVHNPTGSVLADDRRRRLARLAERHGTVVVDDTALVGTLIEGTPTVSIAGLTTSERVLTIGSMSKLFWSGLRLGWIRGPAQAIARLAQMKGMTDLGTSLVSQQIGVHLLDRLPDAQATRRRQLAEGLATLTGLLTDHLPAWTWQRPRGGASLWVRIPTDSVTSFAHVALRFGVAILPGTAFSPAGVPDDHTRLPYALPRGALVAGVQRLTRAWNAYTDGHRDLPAVGVRT
ncbi:PLP-dependent aminotransferase family protein [Actinopolymorpha alba]|uniref:aminotransferase-like domain-containing protein n=1 Tax=Actinopolymorpha alba TaxID=533267 RepID=UPI0003637F8A|nr:PLP-dependent aminotransferase family protein [Actinopolymorpha alba]